MKDIDGDAACKQGQDACPQPGHSDSADGESKLEEFKEHASERCEEIKEELDEPVSSKPFFARMTKADVIKFAGLLVFFAIMAIACIACMPLISEIAEPGGVDRIVAQVRDAGVLGVFLLLGLQFLQIIVAFIPGEVVQVAAGMMFGPWWGAVIVLVGCLCSSAIIYFLVLKLGAPFVQSMIPAKGMEKLRDFQKTDKLDIMVFILFLIPGLPKDVFTYLVPLTGMKMSSFLILTTIGRIPGVIMSTYAANGIMEGNFAVSIAIFVAAGVIAILGIVFRDKIMALFHRGK